MPWPVLSIFRRIPKDAHDALFDFRQGVIGEQRHAESLKDLAEVAEENLATFAALVENTKKYEGGDQDVAEAARALREGFATLIATPAHLYPTDPEPRRESMQIPSDGSTSSPPMLGNGHPGGSSQKALGVMPTQADPVTTGPKQPNGQGPELPRRRRGRPPGSKSKKTQPSQPPTEGQDGRKA